jgi:hypothetical protein
LTGGTVITWSERVSKRLKTAGTDVLTKEVWEGCGFVLESLPEKSLAGESVAFSL